ncbi:hypothetical protein [Cupriavidus basilensis]|uniref:hypothetical protein n=1 Tax=Cupriavidus basilensis TaxID=68895 RepID=UPI0007C6CCFD|nr:hypothetical protein [Cupriavidus basilensis]
MTKPINDGGQAFPLPVTFDRNGHACEAYPGMTLRDYFAAKAMGGMLADPNVKLDGNLPTQLAELAYTVADAMLAAREMGHG